MTINDFELKKMPKGTHGTGFSRGNHIMTLVSGGHQAICSTLLMLAQMYQDYLWVNNEPLESQWDNVINSGGLFNNKNTHQINTSKLWWYINSQEGTTYFNVRGHQATCSALLMFAHSYSDCLWGSNHPFSIQVQILVAVDSHFCALNDKLLICATQKDQTTLNICTGKYSSSRNI